MSLISLVYPTKHIIYQNLGEIGEMPCPTLFGGYVERLLSTRCFIHSFKVISLLVPKKEFFYGFFTMLF